MDQRETTNHLVPKRLIEARARIATDLGFDDNAMDIDDSNNFDVSIKDFALSGTISLHGLGYTIVQLNTTEDTDGTPCTLPRRWKLLETKLIEIYQNKGEGFFCNSGHLVELRDYLFIAFEDETTVAGFVTIEPFVLKDGWEQASWTESFDNKLPKKLQIQFIEAYAKDMGSVFLRFAEGIASVRGIEIIEALDVLPGTESFWTANYFERGFPDRYDNESSTFFAHVDCDDRTPHDINPLEFEGAFFRLNKPYGLYIHKTKPVTVPFNRYYCALGSTKEHATRPTGYIQSFLYDDASKPWESIENHTKYERRFAELIPDDDLCRICETSCVENTRCGYRYNVAEGEWLDPKPEGYIDHWIPTSHPFDYGTSIAYCDECAEKYDYDIVDSIVRIRGARFLIRDTQRYND